MNAIIQQFNRECNCGNDSDCLLVQKLRRGGLNEDQIVVVIGALWTTCTECFNNEAELCHCYNDE